MFHLENLFLDANRAIDEKNLAEAKSMLEEILEHEPSYGRAHNHLGWIYETKFKDYKRAYMHYDLAVKFCKHDYPVAYVNFGYLLIDYGEFDKALEIIEEGLTCKGVDRSVLYYQKGKIAEARQKFAKALKWYKKAKRESFNKDFFNFLNGEIARVSKKQGWFRRLIGL